MATAQRINARKKVVGGLLLTTFFTGNAGRCRWRTS